MRNFSSTFRRCAILCFMLLAVPVGTNALARDIYVNNQMGNDLFPGTSPTPGEVGQGPCRTITRALRLVGPGDRVVIANTGEPYRECITLQGGPLSGTPGYPVVIEGNGAVLDGSMPVPASAWEHVKDDVFRFLPPQHQFNQLYLEGQPALQVETDPFAESLPELEPLEWCRNEGYLYFRVEKDRLPGSYALSYAHHPVGITLYEVRHIVVQDLVVQGFRLDGVNAHDNVTGELAGLTCRGNGRSGISVGGSSQVLIAGCLIGNNGEAQVRTEGYCTVEISNCTLLDNTAPPLVVEGGDVMVDGEIVVPSE